MTPHEDDNYVVYMHTNTKNDKKYIGITRYKNPKRRWGKDGIGYKKGQDKFYNAIKKYGWDTFKHEILVENISQDEALALEERLIIEYDSVKNGYNSSPTGYKNYITEKGKENLRKIRVGSNNPNYKPEIKHTYTKSRNKEIQEKNKRTYYTFEENETNIDGRKSLEFRQKQRELKCGENNPNYGKHSWCYGKKLTEKQKEKMYKAWTDERKSFVSQQKTGKKNPQAKAILCVTTGILYDTITEAAKQNNMSERTVSDNCHNRTKLAKGLKFCYFKRGDE